MKGLKLSLAVGLCDPEDLDDCLIDIDLLKDAVFPFPKLNADGTITFEWRKYSFLKVISKPYIFIYHYVVVSN